MQVVFSAILSQIKIDDKGGGFLLTLSVPEIDKEEMAKVLICPHKIFSCVLISNSGKEKEMESDSKDT